MTFNHPRTSIIDDPSLPPVSTLLESATPPPIEAVVAGTGGGVRDGELLQVTWWPGSSITARYRIEIEGGDLAGTSTFVCVAGRIPDGALIVDGDTGRVGVWRVPHDPALPGLAAALDAERAGQLLHDLGGSAGAVTTRLVSYRPGRRAVVVVSGAADGLFLKVLRPSKVEFLHRAHQLLAEESLPVPVSHGYSADLGLIALQSVSGRTLRSVLEDPAQALPSAVEIVALSRRLPPPPGDRFAVSPIERLDDTVRLLSRITPEVEDRLRALMTAIGPEAGAPDTPSHGDYYESQLLVESGALVGMLDVDTYGWGRPADDAATMLGHLSVWSGMSAQPDRVRDLGARLIEIWDELLDPADLRRRVAAVVLSLAAGPFRVQTATWPEETAERVRIAERWAESVRQVG